MSKKLLYFLITVPVVIVLAACSSISLPGSKTSSTAQNQQNPTANFANQPVDSKLVVGTLKLEGTAQAVSAEQAKTLLPLWSAVKSLSASSNTSTEELNAVYQQIQEAMTPAQLQAIKALNLSQADLQALMQQYGVTLPQGGAAVKGTLAAKSGSSSGNSGAGGVTGGGIPLDGGVPGGGGIPADGGGFSGNGQSTSSGTVRTPQAGQANSAFRGGMNNLLLDPLIKLLQQRASA